MNVTMSIIIQYVAVYNTLSHTVLIFNSLS